MLEILPRVITKMLVLGYHTQVDFTINSQFSGVEKQLDFC